MQTRGGDNPDRWNVFYRSSADGGGTWSSPVRISDAPPGSTAYHHATGFDEIYGDYGEIAVTNNGKTFATWGERETALRTRYSGCTGSANRIRPKARIRTPTRCGARGEEL
jgi:hypothetical protein